MAGVPTNDPTLEEGYMPPLSQDKAATATLAPAPDRMQPPLQPPPAPPGASEEGYMPPLPGSSDVSSPQQARRGVGESLGYGLRHSVEAFGQSASAYGHQAPAPIHDVGWLAEPFERQDVYHPIDRLLPKLAFNFADNHPELAAGIVGAALGGGVGTVAGGPAAPITGPVGAILGGATAAAAMHVVHSIGPYYFRELMQTPNDKQGALDRAWHAAKVSGGLTAASWALYGLQPMRTVVGNLLFQTGAQSTLAGGSQVAQNVSQGRPWMENVPETAGSAAVATAAPGALFLAGKAAANAPAVLKDMAKVAAGMTEAGPMTAAEIKGIAKSSYQAMDAMGPVPDVAALGKVKNDIYSKVVDARGNPKFHQGVFDLINELDQGNAGRPPEMSDIGLIRHELSDLYFKNRTENLGHVARTARDLVDGFMRDEKALQDVGYAPDKAQAGAEAASRAAQFHRLGEQIDSFDQIAAEVARNPSSDKAKVWKQQLRSTLNHHASDFDPEIRKAMDAIILKGPEGYFESLPIPAPWRLAGAAFSYLGSLLHPYLGPVVAGLGSIKSLVATLRQHGDVAAAEALENQIRWQATPEAQRPPPVPPPSRRIPMLVRPVPLTPQLAQPPSVKDSQGNAYPNFKLYDRGGHVDRALRIARNVNKA